MYGALLGDMVGAPFEFDRGGKTKDFEMFTKATRFTDDSVMTIAVAEALMETHGQSDDAIRAAVVRSMQKWGRKYPHAGYGGRFRGWLKAANPQPYGSYGNGSAMRVSAAGWLFDTIEETRHMARLTSEVTHNHPEGIKGAEVTASAIFLARNGRDKSEIRDYIIREFGYDLSRTCDEIRPTYHHDESCQRTVPEAITAFLEGTSFEDVIRTAVSLGGDCDTLTCIAGSIAEAFYGVPNEMIAACRDRLPQDMLQVVDRFQQFVAPMHDSFLEGNEIIDAAIDRFFNDRNKENLINVLEAIRRRMHADGHFLVPVVMSDNGEFVFRTLEAKDGTHWLAAFTTQAAYKKGAPSQILSNFIDTTLSVCLDNNAPGFVINPWDKAFLLSKELIEMIFWAEENAKKKEAQKRSKSDGRKPASREQRKQAPSVEVPADARIAMRSDWNTEPMPDQHVEFTMQRHISAQQMGYLRRGHIPQEMEDKWFWYMEGDELYAHRSWTGICAFILRFEPDSDVIHVTINRNPEESSSSDAEEDIRMINHLLDWWCQSHYDYYNEWLSETMQSLKKQGKIPEKPEE